MNHFLFDQFSNDRLDQSLLYWVCRVSRYPDTFYTFLWTI